VTSAFKRRLGLRAWKAVHWCAYACWPFAFLHGLTAGTDGQALWARAVYVVCGASVLAAIAARLPIGETPGEARARPVPNATSGTPVAAWRPPVSR
jgi:sulfoxide reductase heme-binding subunit YedZ